MIFTAVILHFALILACWLFKSFLQSKDEWEVITLSFFVMGSFVNLYLMKNLPCWNKTFNLSWFTNTFKIWRIFRDYSLHKIQKRLFWTSSIGNIFSCHQFVKNQPQSPNVTFIVVLIRESDSLWTPFIINKITCKLQCLQTYLQPQKYFLCISLRQNLIS